MCKYQYEMLVNRSHALPDSYVPANLVIPDIPFLAAKDETKRLLEYQAALSAERLFGQSRKVGLSLYGISGYRPYSRQDELYQNARDKHYVAPPGCSEHQTGLALDVSCPLAEFDLMEAFDRTPEGRWLHQNAPLYGFILRYPKKKEKITGYAYEPWHIRYVTRALALYLTLTGLSLEEYHRQPATAPSDVP